MTATIDFRSPSGGFDEPLELWLACHERVQRFCLLLERLRRYVEEHGADTEAANSATSIRRYFNEAAPRHHADEEVDLFPRLLLRLAERPTQIDAAEAMRVRSAIDTLTSEHRTNETVWTALDATLAQIERGVAARLNPDQVDTFGRTYRQHIQMEESVVMPALKSHLTEADWKEVGAVMAKRRGVSV